MSAAIEVRRVSTRADQRALFRLPWQLYRNDSELDAAAALHAPRTAR